MANNIAQLKDYNDNNIFPIAGGMVADSVTTQMLQDGSVTSDKIDWATQTINLSSYAASGATVSRATAKVWGKLCEISFNITATLSASADTALLNLPSNLLPAQVVELPPNRVSVANTTPRRVYISPQGVLNASGEASGSSAIVSSGVYLLA